MTEKIDYKKTAFILTAGEPMAFKAFPDGSLVVIAHDGKKHRFTAEQPVGCAPVLCAPSSQEIVKIQTQIHAHFPKSLCCPGRTRTPLGPP